MFKKAFQIAATFCLLVGGYAGYARVFAVVADRLGQVVGGDSVPFPEVESKSAIRANELARESLGASSWAAHRPRIVHYDAARGYYLYADNYERLDEGKRLRIWPFALIWASKDGRSRKTATSEEAVIDLSQPFGLAKPNSEPSHILHAKMVGDVRLRDDKGTRDDPSDDLRVGPVAQLDYDEKTLQITTESQVFLQDRDLTMTGLGMMIQLRRKVPTPGEPPSPGGVGFDAESALFRKDVHIVVKNVGPTGILPGTDKPEKSGQKPIDLRSDSRMLITLPRPRPVVLIGPPDLNREPDPTLAHFETNIRVLQGTVTPDQLNSDTLDLTFVPGPKPDAAPTVAIATVDGKPAGTGTGAVVATGAPAPAAAGSGGPLTDLKLRKALARGHAVWLQSEAQGMKARCTELKYEKATEPGVPDKTYLFSESPRKLWVEKVEFDTKAADPTTVKSVLTLTSLDATIFDYGPGGTSKVIARGPGKTEERPARNASVSRTAWWEDQMDLLTWRDGQEPPGAPGLAALTSTPAATSAPAPAARGTLRRLVTLTGVSKLVEHKDPTTLDARRSIVAEFESTGAPAGGDGGSRIKWLQGFEDVHLTAPGRTLTARKQLDAKFVPAALALVAGPSDPAPAPTGPTSTFVAPAPALAAKAPASAEAPAMPEAPPSPPVQAVDARADRVWATILLGSGERPNGELKDAQLRGGVMVHQDPAPGKAAGSDASGEALDLFGQGNGLMKFVVAAEPPQAAIPTARLASGGKARPAPSTPTTLARVDFEGRTIEAPLIGLDQKADFAYAQGAGHFLQSADRGFLDDKGHSADGKRVGARPDGPNPGKDRMLITWTEEMKFFGRSQDLEGRPAAKAEFRGVSKEIRTVDGKREFRRGVLARMEDAGIDSDEMDVYMDREIALNKDARKPAAAAAGNRNAPAPAEPDAQIALMDCRGRDRVESGRLQYAGVDITSQKPYEGSPVLREKYRIQNTHVVYDKRTGDFEAPGAGTTYLYKRKDKAGDAGTLRPTVLPVAMPSGRAGPGLGIDPRKVPPLELTKVTYTEGMRGRFGTSKDQAETQTRHAEFVGNVQAANATVQSPNSGIDFDRPNSADYLFLTSDVLHVYSVPPPVASRPARTLMNATGNAAARTLDRTIQADRITYDSATELTYAYGDDDREVVMVEQKSPGQPPSTVRGKSGLYNKATKQAKIDDPQAIQFIALGTGSRPKPFYPDTGGTPKPGDPVKPQRMPFMKTQRSNSERSGFTGH